GVGLLAVGLHPAAAVTWAWAFIWARPSPGRGPSSGRGRHLGVGVTWAWALSGVGLVWGGLISLVAGCGRGFPFGGSFAGRGLSGRPSSAGPPRGPAFLAGLHGDGRPGRRE